MALQPKQLDASYWKACAGECAHIPAVGEAVYYFPSGHSQQVPAGRNLSAICCSKPILCTASSIGLHAEEPSDEVYAMIGLLPFSGNSEVTEPEVAANSPAPVEWHMKVVTKSDASTSSRFTMWKDCARDMQLPEKVQTDATLPEEGTVEDPATTPDVFSDFKFTDAHGKEWNIQHKYGGEPKRHLLKTGWSDFMKSKKVEVGDSMVFLKVAEGNPMVGLRRVRKVEEQGGDARMVKPGDAFWRRNIGMVPAEAVLAAVLTAWSGTTVPIEVAYYPQPGRWDFVVGRKKVETAVGIPWEVGRKVRMRLDVEGKSGSRWINGTIIEVKEPRGCPSNWWAMLQVEWELEKSGVSQPKAEVNPWDVELLPETLDSPKRKGIQGARQQKRATPSALSSFLESCFKPSFWTNSSKMRSSPASQLASSALSLCKSFTDPWTNSTVMPSSTASESASSTLSLFPSISDDSSEMRSAIAVDEQSRSWRPDSSLLRDTPKKSEDSLNSIKLFGKIVTEGPPEIHHASDRADAEGASKIHKSDRTDGEGPAKIHESDRTDGEGEH